MNVNRTIHITIGLKCSHLVVPTGPCVRLQINSDIPVKQGHSSLGGGGNLELGRS